MANSASTITLPSGEVRHQRQTLDVTLDYVKDATDAIVSRKYTFKDGPLVKIVQRRRDGSFETKTFDTANADTLVKHVEHTRNDFASTNYVDRTTFFEAGKQRVTLGADYAYPVDYTVAIVPDELKVYMASVYTDGVRHDVIGYLSAEGIVERVYDGTSSSGYIAELKTILGNTTTVTNPSTQALIRTEVTETSGGAVVITTKSPSNVVESTETVSTASGITSRRFVYREGN